MALMGSMDPFNVNIMASRYHPGNRLFLSMTVAYEVLMIVGNSLNWLRVHG